MAIDKHNWSWLKPMLPGCNVLTLGHQHWCVGRRRAVKERVFSDEEFLKAGALNVDSLDCSPFEEATVLWDLNEPVPKNLINKYDLIFDGGTLEHVFNTAQALENVRSMLRLNGVFCSDQMLNFSGHGFWGFSPEVMFSWSKLNGFIKQDCRVARLGPLPVWHSVTVENTRVEFMSTVPLRMLFSAVKQREVLATAPIQNGPTETVGRLQQFFTNTRLWKWPKLK